MRYRRIPFALLSVSLAALGAASAIAAGVNVLTQHNDNLRTGQNLNETILTPANVNSTTFGKLFDRSVDGYVYAQPLYMSGVSITSGTNQGTHNVVFVATEHDSVYAFDADSNSGANAKPLWFVSFINNAIGVSTVPNNEVGTDDIVPEIGITSTPVIDGTTGVLYVLVKTKKFDPANPSDSSSWSYHQHLFALDIHTGHEAANIPAVAITASVNGSGDGNDGHGHVPFNSLTESNRVSLLLLNGVVYVGWASHGDNGPYHGWLLGYNESTLKLVANFNTTPDGSEAGIWMSGAGLAADANSRIFCSTGNGTYDTDTNGNHVGRDYGDSVLRFATSPSGAITLTGSFTPYNQDDLRKGDIDLGSGGVLLLPDQPGSFPHMAITCGKQGTVYLLNRDQLGGFHSTYNSLLWGLPGAIPNGTWSTAAYFNGKIYYHGNGDVLKSFHLNNSQLILDTVVGPNYFNFPGATPSISANGSSNGVLWEIDTEGYGTPSPAILYAYDPTNIATELYDTTQAANNRDVPGDGVTSGFAAKFAVPTIANGKVYVGSQYALTVYGLLPQ